MSNKELYFKDLEIWDIFGYEEDYFQQLFVKIGDSSIGLYFRNEEESFNASVQDLSIIPNKKVYKFDNLKWLEKNT